MLNPRSSGNWYSISQSAVAAAPRHDDGNRPIRNSGRPSEWVQARASSPGLPRRGLCAVRAGRLRQFRPRSGIARHHERNRSRAGLHAEICRTCRPSRPLSSRGAFCISPTCPITRSIASADMKQPFGAKSARSCLRLMPWIAANRRIESVGSVSAAGKTCQPTSPMSIEFERGDRDLLGQSGI